MGLREDPRCDRYCPTDAVPCLGTAPPTHTNYACFAKVNGTCPNGTLYCPPYSVDNSLQCIIEGSPCDAIGPNQCCSGLKCSNVNRLGNICNPTYAAAAIQYSADNSLQCITRDAPCDAIGPNQCCSGLKCSNVNRLGNICNPTYVVAATQYSTSSARPTPPCAP